MLLQLRCLHKCRSRRKRMRSHLKVEVVQVTRNLSKTPNNSKSMHSISFCPLASTAPWIFKPPCKGLTLSRVSLGRPTARSMNLRRSQNSASKTTISFTLTLGSTPLKFISSSTSKNGSKARNSRKPLLRERKWVRQSKSSSCVSESNARPCSDTCCANFALINS